MLKIRLQRVGRKHDPSFRVVLVDSRRGPKTGNFKEILGSYDARKGEPVIDGDRVKHWIAQGAQVSDTVHNLLIKLNVIEGKKIAAHAKSKKKEEEAPKEEVKKDTTEEKPVEEKKEEVKPIEENKEELKLEVETKEEVKEDIV